MLRALAKRLALLRRVDLGGANPVPGLGVVDEGERVAVGDSKDAAPYNLGRGAGA